MPSVYDLKPAFQTLLRPVCRALVEVGITANQVTIGALVLSCGVGGLVYWNIPERWPLLLVPVALLLRMALNAIDGMIAREHDMTTPLGAVLNELGDVLSDAAVYLPLAAVPALPPALMVTIVVLAVISEMSGVIAVQIGASRRYDGPMGKSDRAVVFGATCLALGLGAPAGVWIEILLLVVLALLIATILNRTRRALAERAR